MLVCDFGMCTFGTFETATWGSVFYDIGTLWCCKNQIPKSSKANKIPGKILFMGAKVQIRPKVDFGLLGCSVAHSTQNRVLIPNMGWDSPNSACRPRYGPKKILRQILFVYQDYFLFGVLSLVYIQKYIKFILAQKLNKITPYRQ